MPVWNVPPPSAEPCLTVENWSVIECTKGNRYLLGWCIERREGRVSTAIITFDAEAMAIKTASGRKYRLKGPPGVDPDALHVWPAYAAVNGIVPKRDVTSDYPLASEISTSRD